MPRAYWLLPSDALSSLLMLVQPSAAEFQRTMAEMARAGDNDYDMEILNRLYRDSALVLPHRPYALLTTEFRQGPDKHGRYLGGDDRPWDPVAVVNEAKVLHFSDWPVPKPWLPMSEGVREAHQPECWEREGVAACVERELWNGFYREFGDRREVRLSSLVFRKMNVVDGRTWLTWHSGFAESKQGGEGEDGYDGVRLDLGSPSCIWDNTGGY